MRSSRAPSLSMAWSSSSHSPATSSSPSSMAPLRTSLSMATNPCALPAQRRCSTPPPAPPLSHGRAAALLASPSFFFPCAAARSPCSQSWRPTSLRSGADPKQQPRIPRIACSLDLRSPNIDAVHPGEEPRVLRGEGKSFNARRMLGAMHKSESPSSLQTPIGFVYGPRDDDRAVMWCHPQDAVGGRPEEWT
uniref:Uncharacterized protein n=1 Tax=Zea mays TaxID=4577 RepID=C4J5D1_MAIZE|nr:unknown [Zea mays]